MTAVRRRLYGGGWLPVFRAPVPVLVVGNITVGGTGKTPLVLWLCTYLESQGLRPGVVSRGHGGTRTQPRHVRPDSDPREDGDEPVLIARRSACPVVAARDRAAAARMVASACDVIVSDDGLQHYALGRDIEIAVIDGDRRFGNGQLLPAGPLREPVARLRDVAMVVANGTAAPGEFAMVLRVTAVQSLRHPRESQPIEAFRGRPVHAVAGIGHPQRFFASLRAHGLDVIPHAFPDHHAYQAADLEPWADATVLMTEKDAVKCAGFAGRDWWSVVVDAELPAVFAERLNEFLENARAGQPPARDPGVPRHQGTAHL